MTGWQLIGGESKSRTSVECAMYVTDANGVQAVGGIAVSGVGEVKKSGSCYAPASSVINCVFIFCIKGSLKEALLLDTKLFALHGFKYTLFSGT